MRDDDHSLCKLIELLLQFGLLSNILEWRITVLWQPSQLNWTIIEHLCKRKYTKHFLAFVICFVLAHLPSICGFVYRTSRGTVIAMGDVIR